MLSIAKRTVPGLLILLIMPIAVWGIGWHWHPGNNAKWLKLFYWVTETVTQPWGVITHVLLCGWFVWCLWLRLKPALILFLLLSLTIACGQGVKSWIKNRVQEPRPYVVWLEEKYQMPIEQFYTLSRAQRAIMIKRQLHEERAAPAWLQKHWQKEAGFAFPSGHTIFAASWALLATGLLWPRRRIATIVTLMVWAIAVMGSRLVLGMHWPQDLIAGAVLSWLLATVVCWFIQRLCDSRKSLEKGRKERVLPN